MNKNNIAEHVYTIAPYAPFLDRLVWAVLEGPLLGDWPKDNPFWLSDVTIILPTQRAKLALSSAFSRALGGGATLPDIQTLGAQDDDKLLFEMAGGTKFPKAIGRVDRQFLLCKLVEKWAEAASASEQPHTLMLHRNPARILSLANSLGELIDEMETENILPEALRAMPTNHLNPQAKGDWAANFEQNLDFLEIALSYWPNALQELGLVDMGYLQKLKINQQIKHLQTDYTDRPVIAAGSTGSVPSTANLLKAIAGLKRGRLVLPGLDTSLTPQNHQDLLDTKNAPHGHPQYGLSQLLRRLGLAPSNVKELASKPNNQRSHIVHHALALAKDTANWNKELQSHSKQELNDAMAHCGIIVCKNQREQALAVALAARQNLANKKTVGIISPDRNFSRRVAVELKRFNIEVDDSAGTPLFHSSAGRLIRKILAAVTRDFSAVDLIALLHTPLVNFGQNSKTIFKTTNLLEFALLRGQRPQLGLWGLRKSLAQNLAKELDYPTISLSPEQGEAVAKLIDDLEQSFVELATLFAGENFTSKQLSRALLNTLHALAPQTNSAQVNSLVGLSELNDWAKEITASTYSGPLLRTIDVDAVLQSLMANYSVRTHTPGREDIFIWGRLEARMQSADLIIMCTLNEGIWPEIADPGPWLSRGMRLHAGLEPPERAHGLAAHDFEMMMGHKNVLLSYAERIGTGPALPSRLVERLCGFVGAQIAAEMKNRGAHWLTLAREMDRTGPPVAAIRPAPCPPAIQRPGALSITEIETLIRSPFDLYAKYVLKLKPINSLGEDLNARERGTLIHAVFEAFVKGKHDPIAAEAHQQMMGIAKELFSPLNAQPDRRDIWLRRLDKSAQGFLNFERERHGEISQRLAEQKLLWQLNIEGQPFEIRGVADRIDIRHDGQVEILDFKTGGIPDKILMQNFMAPQLLIEAAIVKQVGFKTQGPRDANKISYIKIGADPVGFSLTDFSIPNGMNIGEASEALMNITRARISAFLLNDHLPMTARIMPKANQSFAGPYDHLARTGEWSQAEAGSEDT